MVALSRANGRYGIRATAGRDNVIRGNIRKTEMTVPTTAKDRGLASVPTSEALAAA